MNFKNGWLPQKNNFFLVAKSETTCQQITGVTCTIKTRKGVVVLWPKCQLANISFSSGQFHQHFMSEFAQIFLRQNKLKHKM